MAKNHNELPNPNEIYTLKCGLKCTCYLKPLLEEKKIENVEVGDILVFQNSGRIITHRVLGIVDTPEGRIYKTKGDSNPTYDSFDVMEKDSIGIVRYVVKYVGFPTVWFNENIRRIKG